jgi:uncharacterized caspase-like protein
MRVLGAIVVAICLSLFSQPALAVKRVALVIGNSAYQNVGRLTNPANDSEAMSAMLKNAGFDVVDLKHDLNANGMRRALRDFSDKVRDADIGILYFAGHGIEIDGINYVIPVDAVLERDIDAFDEAIPLDRLLTVIEPARQLRLVILDACRDNPFGKTMKRTIASRAIGRGLAKVEPTSPNTLVAFAAKAGSTAFDGDSENSPFTAALVKYLPRPGLDLRRAFGFARDEVLKITNNRQEPFIYGSLGGDDVALVPAVPAQPAAASSVDPNAAVRRDYELALQISTKPVWDSFINKYPSGFYTDLAKAQRDRLIAEVASTVANEKAKAAADEQKRLAAEGARATEQSKAAEQAKAADLARIAADKQKELEDAKVAEAERAKAAAQAKAEEEAKVAAGTSNAADQKTGPESDSVGRLAALTPQQADVAPSKQDSPAAANIPRLLQAELRRVGCNTGVVDGNWNAAAQKSLLLFNKNAGTKFDTKVASLNALEGVRSRTERVCPLVCAHGYKADGDNCTRIICDAGFEVGDDNTCKRVQVKKREKPVANVSPSAVPDSATPRNATSNPAARPGPKEYQPMGSGKVSNGNCTCKSNCDKFAALGQLSGAKVGQCKSDCEQKYAGCNKGALR